MDLLKARTSGHAHRTTSLNGWFSSSVAFCSLVDAEGGVGLIILTGEISNQLTITDHQEQAATYKTRGTVNILTICRCEGKSCIVSFYLMPATTATP